MQAEEFKVLVKAPTWKACDKPGDPLRGISVHYLSTSFLQDVEEAGFSRESNIHEIEKAVIRGKGADVECPRDGRPGTAFVDAVSGEDNVGCANMMLSYTWGYAVGMIVDALVDYCARKNLDPKRTYIWICALCINQHRVQEAKQRDEHVSFEDFASEFGSRVKGIRHVLALMGPWDSPRYIERCWCIFELAVAMTIERCTIDIVMPPSELDSFTRALLDDSGSGLGALERVWQLLHNVCIRRAEASVPEDKENIMHFIENGPGLIFFNNQVRSKLESWFLSVAEERVRELMETCQCNLIIRKAVQVAEFLQEGRQFENALNLLKHCFEVCSFKIDEENTAIVLAAMGKAEHLCFDTDTALAHLKRAVHLREERGTLETDAGARLLADLGAVEVTRGALQSALEGFYRARWILESLGGAKTARKAGLLVDISLVEATIGNACSAIRSYEAARGVQKVAEMALTPTGISFPFINSTNPPTPSCDLFARASTQVAMSSRVIEVYRSAGTLETIHGAFALAVRGYLQANLGDYASAAAGCTEASRIYSALGLEATPFAIEVLETLGFAQSKLGDSHAAAKSGQEVERRRGMMPGGQKLMFFNYAEQSFVSSGALLKPQEAPSTSAGSSCVPWWPQGHLLSSKNRRPPQVLAGQVCKA